jgi:alpha-L-fucosidase
MRLFNFLIVFVVTLALVVNANPALQAVVKLPTEDPPHGPLHPLLAEVIESGPYKPQWESLVKHPMPEWFINDKIGLSAHWGPYAVPGWTPRKDTPYGVAYAEWYWEWLKSNEVVKEYHKKNYGDAKYDDFIDGTKNLVTGKKEGFFAENFDADEWMSIFKKAGVKYFFITSKHHDGFCIWDSEYTDRNSMKMGPRRDLYGELVAAARRHGLRIGLYYSYYEWNNPIYRNKEDLSGYKGIKKLGDEDGDGDSSEFVDDFMIPQIKELIDKYHPDYLCFDGEWEHGYPYWRSRQLVAYYYNQAAARGQEVVINDRFGQAKEGVSDTRGVYGDFRHVEYYANVDRAKPWAMWRGFGNSYGYNRNEHPDNILSTQNVIRMIIDCVSDNGNIEFNIGPKADGTLAEFELERLEAMGEWLAVNGEAIYGTEKSIFKKLGWGKSTTKGNTIYLHVYDWPKDHTLEVPGLKTKTKKAYLLHDPERQGLEVTDDGKGRVVIDLLDYKPFKYASVVALDLEPEPEVKNKNMDDKK